MKPGDLVEWRAWDGNPKYYKRGIVIRKSNIFGWLIYFPTHKKSKFDHLGESAIKKIQPAEEK